MIESDEILTAMDDVSADVTSAASINCHSKKGRDCYILHTVLLTIILLLIITIIYYHYAKHRSE